MARIRTTPEDFRVDEIPLYPPVGEGDHTFVRVEKRLLTTEDVARALARLAKVQLRDIGYAGRKDRAAVATQWLSVPGLDPSTALAWSRSGVRVLEAERHPHKLRTGHLRGNRFEIAVRDVSPKQCETARANLDRLCGAGMPNRYGSQRFGRDGNNVQRATRLLRGELRVTNRREARFLISALQSSVFNAVLDARPAPLDELEAGDVAVIHSSGGQFLVEDPALEQARATAFEISPTGPIFGNRVIAAGGAVAAREQKALEAHAVNLDGLELPRGLRVRGARRALRVRPERANIRVCGGGFRLDFELPAGSYATELIREVLGEAPMVGAERSPTLGEASPIPRPRDMSERPGVS